MAQIFHPSMNTLARVSILGGVFIVAAAGVLLAAVFRSPFVTGVGVALEQPVPFSHAHHVSGLGIDCRYCHTSVESSSFAGIPSTETCMNCHAQVWSDSPTLESVRESLAANVPLIWARVYDLPDFVYFNHGIHVHKGVGCVTCHGPVDGMPLTWKAETLQMDWCLECHRNPEAYLRPRERVFDMAWTPGPDDASGEDLASEYGVEPLLDCSTCHR